MEAQRLPKNYENMNDAEALKRIKTRKSELGGRLVILGHHYQRDEIFQLADFVGDSLELARQAAQQTAEFIVFCGVHFMAESADVLTGPEQKVFLPDMSAGCPMADMADIEQVEQCWAQLQMRVDRPERIVPVCYVNSTAAIKAFCGRHEGMSCTSSNCRAIFEHIWRDRPDGIILFLPDEHLARNTAAAMGVSLENMAMWNPLAAGHETENAALAQAKLILWRGYCEVHQEFTAAQIAQARKMHPGIKIMVHPECGYEVARRAELSGSTGMIIKTVREAPAGSIWAIGTEMNMVRRLARDVQPKGVQVHLLTDFDAAGRAPAKCKTMALIDPQHLAWLLDEIAAYAADPAGRKLPNQVTVDARIAKEARLALERMLAVK